MQLSGGAVFGFLSFLGGPQIGNALFMYPVGLLLGLMWFYGGIAVANIQSTNPSLRLLGWGHMLGLVTINVLVAVLLLKQVISDIWK